MDIKLHESKVKSIRQGDKRFMINDGFVSYPRAMMHILPGCPTSVVENIQWAIDRGYLKCVANMTERELIFMGLSDEL